MNRITTKLPDVGLVGICMLSAIALLVAFGVSRVAGASTTPAAMPETGKAQAASGSGASAGSAMAMPNHSAPSVTQTTPTMSGDSPEAIAAMARMHARGSMPMSSSDGMAGMNMSQPGARKGSPRDKYQKVSCPGDNPVHNVFEHKTSYYNGRTECVIVSADGTPAEGVLCPGDKGHDNCYIDYEPYQQDTTPGDSEWDRGSAIRYHNGEKYAGMSMAEMMGMGYLPGCWRPSARAKAPRYNSRDDRAGKADLQALLTKVLAKYTGPGGFATALADGWYPYPVPESKAWHMIRQFWAGDMNPKDPAGTQLNVRNIESFVLIYTDSGWQVRTGMFMLGDEGDKAPPVGKDGHAPLGAYDYIEIDKPAHLPVWRDPIHKGLVCQLEWHGHDGAEGAATSFDAKHPSTSPWMSHINLYASHGDPFGQAQDADGSETHAYWAPLHYVPDACNPQGPCE